MAIRVTINGEEEEIAKGLTVAEVLEAKKVRPELVAVELNGEMVDKERYGSIVLKNSDSLEFLHYMAGGNWKLISLRWCSLSLGEP